MGRCLLLFAIVVLAGAPAAAQQDTVIHVVQPGENLFRIAMHYGVRIDAITLANRLTSANFIYPGQRLSIPGARAAPPPEATTHTVTAGETLFRIARQYGVSMHAIMEANAIANPDRISAGDVLTIPTEAGAAPAAADTPDRVYLEVPAVRQSHNLSCESASVCSVLLYMGYPCPDDNHVLSALPGSPDNPHRGFVGPVSSAPGSLPPGAANYKTGGYGVYVEPISAALNALGVNHNFAYFANLDTLRDLLDANIPAVIIATHGMGIYGAAPVLFTPSDGDGGTVTVIRYEHSYAVIGYDANGFWAIDPWSGGVDYFTNAQLDADWARLGRQALWVLPAGW